MKSRSFKKDDITKSAQQVVYRIDGELNELNSTVDRILNTDKDLQIKATELQTTNFVTGSSGARIDTLGNGEFNNIKVRGSISAATFIKNNVISLAGSLIISKNSGRLILATGTIPAIDEEVPAVLIENDSSGDPVFEVNDYVLIKDIPGILGGAQTTIVHQTWFIVSARHDIFPTYTAYDLRVKAGDCNTSPAFYYKHGTAVVNYGENGDSYIYLSADSGIGSADPNISCVYWVTDPYTASNNIYVSSIGNLNGVYGYSGNTFGAAFGEYKNNSSFITIDGTDGIRVIRRASSVNTKIAQWDLNGNILIGEVGAGKSNVYITSGAIQLRNNITPVFSVNTLGAMSVTGTLSAGTGNTILKFDNSQGLWLGNDTFGSAPFRVSLAGALTAANANITGTITATLGSIGGWTISSTSLTSGSGNTTVGLDSGGTNPALYAGSAVPGSAPFRVTGAGALTSTSGNIGGWTIGATTLTAGSSSTITLDSNTGRIITESSSRSIIIHGYDITFTNVYSDTARIRILAGAAPTIPTLEISAYEVQFINNNGGVTFNCGTTIIDGAIIFQADTNLYRSSADILKTDDTFDAYGYKVDGSAGVTATVNFFDKNSTEWTLTVTKGIITQLEEVPP